jgi:acyl dehydratase
MTERHGATTSTLVEPLSAEQIDALPIYEWDVAEIGDAAPPFTYAVTEASIADYCAAVRNENPLYLDADAARRGPFGGIIAPPTYAFKCAPLRRNEVMHARGYASPEEKGERATPYAKSELFFQRPIRPGDEITSVVRLDDKYERRGSQFMTWRVRAADARGDLALEYTYTIIWRQGPRDPNAQPSAIPTSPEMPAPDAPEDALPSFFKVESQEAIDRYAELTRVRPRTGSSLHSDLDFARRTIFGGTVNMGVATAAYCSELLERAFGPAALLRPGARLEYKGIRPIRAGYEITLSGHVVARRPEAIDCELRVHNRDGTLCGVANATVVTQP